MDARCVHMSVCLSVCLSGLILCCLKEVFPFAAVPGGRPLLDSDASLDALGIAGALLVMQWTD
jgi:hypothetical protein